jgi:ABC-type polysaccharide/polyol phosphate export permease
VKLNPIYYFIEPMQELFVYQKVDLNKLFVAFFIDLVLFLIALFLYKRLIKEIKDLL